jgi:hypothetical protein
MVPWLERVKVETTPLKVLQRLHHLLEMVKKCKRGRRGAAVPPLEQHGNFSQEDRPGTGIPDPRAWTEEHQHKTWYGLPWGKGGRRHLLPIRRRLPAPLRNIEAQDGTSTNHNYQWK